MDSAGLLCCQSNQIVRTSVLNTAHRQSSSTAGPHRERRMPEKASRFRLKAGLVAAARLVRRSDRVETVMDAAQQADQHLAFVLAQARQQAPFALERDDDDIVMGGAPLRRERDRMRSRVLP